MNDNIVAKQIGNLIKIHRIKLDLSQEALAFKADLHRTYIGALERGEKNASINTLLKITKVFDVNLSEFFDKFELNLNNDNS